MNDYLTGIAEQGNCPALFPAGVFDCGGQTIVIWDKSGFMSLGDALLSLDAASGAGVSDAFLDLAGMVFAAALAAEDWLIPQEALDLRQERTGCDPVLGSVRFCLRESFPNAVFKGYCSGKDMEGTFHLLREVHSAADIPGPFPLDALEKRTVAENLGIKSIIKQLGLLRLR